MAGKSTNIHVAGFTFPGTMHEYYWEYPEILVPKKNSDKMITTKYYVGLLVSKVDKSLVATNMNPVKGQKPNPNYNPGFTFNNFTMKLHKNMLNHAPITGAIAFYVTSTQQGDGPALFRDMTFVLKGKSLNRKNHTNVLTQALADVLSKYNSKMETMMHKTQKVVTPMLAEGEGLSGREEVLDKLNNIIMNYQITGVHMQPKYDGIRVLSTLNDGSTTLPFESDNDVICYSRGGKQVMVSDHLLYELKSILGEMKTQHNLQTLILDGEYYYHGMPLQTISGYARGSHQSDEKDKVNLIIYDLYDGTSKSFDERYKLLDESRALFDINTELDGFDDVEIGHVLISDTKLFKNVNDMIEYYDNAIANNYEGVMVRLPDEAYVSSRTKSLIKVKPFLSYEYECTGYDFGKGKDSDIPTIKCKIGIEGIKHANEWWFHRNGRSDVDERSKNNEFSAKFKGISEAEQRKLGEEFTRIEANGKTRFENHYLGRNVTIEFFDFSIDGKPEKPNCKNFTD